MKNHRHNHFTSRASLCNIKLPLPRSPNSTGLTTTYQLTKCDPPPLSTPSKKLFISPSIFMLTETRILKRDKQQVRTLLNTDWIRMSFLHFEKKSFLQKDNCFKSYRILNPETFTFADYLPMEAQNKRTKVDPPHTQPMRPKHLA